MSRMDIGKFVSKFRQVADLLEELFGGINETPLVAERILSDLNGKKKRKYVKRAKKTKKVDPRVGYKYKPGTHWTQRPENKARLSKMVKKSSKTAKVNREAANG